MAVRKRSISRIVSCPFNPILKLPFGASGNICYRPLSASLPLKRSFAPASKIYTRTPIADFVAASASGL